MDSRKVQQVDSYDIVNYLRSNYVNCQLDDAEMIVMAHSELKYLDFEDFARIILPQNDELKKQVALSRKLRDKKMPNQVIYMFQHILEKESDLQRFMSEQVAKLCSEPDFEV